MQFVVSKKLPYQKKKKTFKGKFNTIIFGRPIGKLRMFIIYL